jgi:ribonuclease HII
VTGRTPTSKPPGLRHERELFTSGVRLLAGMDEVGRGSLAGPVSVGIVVIHADVRRPPTGLRDSKLLTPAYRHALVPRIRRWASASSVGHASATEIDAMGLTAALRLAGRRAFDALPSGHRPDLILLDGNYDWFSPPRQGDLFDDAGPDVDDVPPVVTRIKGDLRCASVAAASVLAKTQRDAMMIEYARTYPAFGWDENKGYASPGHQAALAELGPCPLHRLSWRLGDGADDIEGWRATMQAEGFDDDEVDGVHDVDAERSTA